MTLDFAEDLYAFEFWLSFNNSVLNATAVDYTGYLNEPTMIWYQAVNNQEGWVSLSVSSKHHASAKTGGGNLAVVHFKSLAAGTSTLHLYKTHLVDDQAMEISHSTSDGQVTVTSNTPPVASNLVIEPSTPFTADNLIAKYDYYDADGDPENGTEIRWYKNGFLQPLYNNHLTVPASATVKAESWFFTVKPKDGKSFGTLKTSFAVTVSSVEHDVAIKNVAVSKTAVGKGCLLYVNVTVENKYDVAETFNITFYANTTIIHSENFTLLGLDLMTLNFGWNTTQVAMGNYIINVSAILVSEDRNVTDNTFIYGWIAVTILGDLNCDDAVNIIDLWIAASSFNSKLGDERWNSNADVNDDGEINIIDIFQLGNWWWRFQMKEYT